jgi:PKD repeat protein
VSLTTVNADGCRATNTVNIDISPLPNAGFTAGTACLNSPVQFTNTSTISGGTITGYSWDFGDGTGISGLQNPQYAYSQPGTYTVTLIVSSGDGCNDTIVGQVIVNPLPVANFTNLNAQGCGPIDVQFTDSSFISSGSVVAWNWDFGDGGSSTAQNPMHTYTVSGSYPVTLSVTSDSGCVNTVTINNAVNVYPGPMAEFEPDPATQIS